MKILIVDDEPLARERLQDLVGELYPDAIQSQANDGQAALEKIQEIKPEIVLLDIRMPLMDGMEVARHVMKLETQPAIIFTTAYQDHAINAFDANAVDYLLKPIRKERLQVAIERAELINQSKLSKLLETGTQSAGRSHVSSLVNGNLELVPVETIHYLKADQKYVMAVWPEGEILLDESLVSLEAEFNDHFVRIHRNALVAKNKICGLEKNNGGQTLIKLSNMPTELLVSRRHLANVKEVINSLTKR